MPRRLPRFGSGSRARGRCVTNSRRGRDGPSGEPLQLVSNAGAMVPQLRRGLRDVVSKDDVGLRTGSVDAGGKPRPCLDQLVEHFDLCKKLRQRRYETEIVDELDDLWF